MLEFLNEPIHRASVLSLLTFKPDIESNASNKYRVLENEDCEPFKRIAKICTQDRDSMNLFIISYCAT